MRLIAEAATKARTTLAEPLGRPSRGMPSGEIDRGIVLILGALSLQSLVLAGSGGPNP